MQYVKPKIHDETNYYNGVDLNDKAAVEKEFRKRQATHTFFTLIFIAMFGALCVVAFDFYRVYKLEGKPIFAVKKQVDGGYMYEGLGYQVLYCDNDERHFGSIVYDTCTGEDGGVTTIEQLIYNGVMKYALNKEIIDKSKLESLTINSYELDENRGDDGADYLLDVTVVCKGNNKCYKHSVDLSDSNNFKIIARLDKYNSVSDLVYFKTSGLNYDRLLENYKEKIKQHFIDNNRIDVANLKSFDVRLKEFHGKFKFRGTMYEKSYLISVSYTCLDNTNKCVVPFDHADDEGDYTNLYFLASMFIDANDEVVLIGNKEYLSL